MGVETERKFLLKNHSWKEEITTLPRTLTQGSFLRAQGGPTLRVRITEDRGFVTIKGRARGEDNISRSEFEYPIPAADAQAMLEEFCGERIVKKLRYYLNSPDGFTWEIDEYLENNAGLYTAEIELPSPDTPFEIPEWLGEEVSSDKRYSNGSLSVTPYSQWGETDHE